MANYILESRGARRVRKRWAHRFVQRRPELKTRFNYVYDFQRALCENPELIGAWLRLVSNMRAKYGILDCDFYNFDKTGVMMGVICTSMCCAGDSRDLDHYSSEYKTQSTIDIKSTLFVLPKASVKYPSVSSYLYSSLAVTRVDRDGRSNTIQPGNREWATAIVCVNGEGASTPPFLVVQGTYHLSSWYTESELPDDWIIKCWDALTQCKKTQSKYHVLRLC